MVYVQVKKNLESPFLKLNFGSILKIPTFINVKGQTYAITIRQNAQGCIVIVGQSGQRCNVIVGESKQQEVEIIKIGWKTI
jgi:hypothetical protein